MNIAKILQRLRFLPDRLLFKLYPPFFVMGVRIESFSSDSHRLEVSIPLRWWARNFNGTMFGGFMCAVTDPLTALMCHRILPGVEIWTKRHSVEFLKPAKTRLRIPIEIREEEIAEIERRLARDSMTVWTFTYPMLDVRQRVVAQVENTLFFRRPKKLKDGKHRGVSSAQSPRHVNETVG